MRVREVRIVGKCRALALLAALSLATACANSTGPAPSRIERGEDGDFTISQSVRVGMGVRTDFDEAVRLLGQGQNERGIEKLRAVTEAAPQLASAHINLGIAYRRVEDWERAEAAVERALEVSPNHPVAHNELGMVLRRQGRFEEARASYEQALRVAPGFYYARRNLAILCDIFLVDLDCAIKNYERYAKDFPKDESVAMWITDLRNRLEKQPEGEGS